MKLWIFVLILAAPKLSADTTSSAVELAGNTLIQAPEFGSTPELPCPRYAPGAGTCQIKQVLDASAGGQNICDPANSDHCVRYVHATENGTVVRYTPLATAVGCHSHQGVFYSSSELASCQTRTLNQQQMRDLFQRVIYPAVKSAVEAYGLSVTENSCNLASAFTVGLLRMLGVEGARVVEGSQHAYVTVTTSDGDLIVDPTMAQFTRRNAPNRQHLINNGFIGTRQEFDDYVARNIENFKGPSGSGEIPAPVITAARENRTVDEITPSDARGFIATYVENIEHTYFTDDVDDDLKGAADRQIAWYEDHDPTAPFMRKSLFSRFDSTAQNLRDYRALLADLGDYQLPQNNNCQR